MSESAPLAAPGDPKRWRASQGWRASALLAALMLLVYGRSLAHGFVYDDLLHIVDEPVPETLSQLARIFAEPMSPLVPYYRPLPRLLNVAQRMLHGAEPFAFHALNLALGFACAWALRALLMTRALGVSAGVATLAAALFALHPIASECIYAAASGRETLLPTLFTLVALTSYFAATARSRAAALGAFALGLLSKEQAIVVPALLVLADAVRIAPDAPRGVRAWLARYAPYALGLAGYLLARRLAVPDALAPEIALFSQPQGPVLSLLYDVQTSFAPFAQVVYEPRFEVWWSPLRAALAVLAAGALAVAAARASGRRAFWLLALIGLSLAPTANVFVQEPRFAERWGFAALAGWTALLALVLTHAARTNERVKWLRRTVAALCAVAAALSFVRGAAYRDDAAFLAQWLRTDPTSRQALISSGEAHERRGEISEAISDYRRVLALHPDEPLAHASLAIALAKDGQPAQAQRHAERALALDPADAETWSNLGALRAQRGDLAGAIADYHRALTLRPRLASAHNNLALALRRSGDLAGAKTHLEAALSARPQFPEAHANLADILLAQGDPAAAKHHLQRAIELDPSLTPAREALQRLEAAARTK